MKLHEEPSGPPPKVGDRVRYWWAPDGAEVLKVEKFTGLYKEYFSHSVTLKSETPRGRTVIPWCKRTPP